jgi:hypothetical protein
MKGLAFRLSSVRNDSCCDETLRFLADGKPSIAADAHCAELLEFGACQGMTENCVSLSIASRRFNLASRSDRMPRASQ